MQQAPTLLRRIALCAAAILCHGAQAQTDTTSVYTDIDGAKACRPVATPKDVDFEEYLCQGVAGYQLRNRVWMGDGPADVSVRAPNGKLYQLDPMAPAAYEGFFVTLKLGPKVEWRVKTAGGKASPVAMIVRNSGHNISTNETASFLVVSKITPQHICVTDLVPPSANANALAAALADQAASKPCKKP